MCLSSAAMAEDGATDSAPSILWEVLLAENDCFWNMSIISLPYSGNTSMMNKAL